MSEKRGKITKQMHAFKGYPSSYHVSVLNYFNRELQIKYTESGIKNKIIYLLTELKGFNFVILQLRRS